MGLMMGGDLDGSCLANFAQFIHDAMPPLPFIVVGDGEKTDETVIRTPSIENPVPCEMSPSLERFCSVYLQKKTTGAY